MATSLFEPIAISFFGAFVLILVLSIYMPIFTMASHMR
jgi:type II secretory pathway component PulF